jgi:C4-dicarboxylate-specific signal transduction histidine kinase
LALVLVLLIFVSMGVIFWWNAGRKAETEIIARAKNYQETIAWVGAMATGSFFQDRQIELLALSEMDAVKSLQEKEGREALELFFEHLNRKIGPLLAVVRVNKEGTAVWTVNNQATNEGEGVSLADREYFAWASRQEQPGEVYISQPLIGRGGVGKGESGIVIAAPVFYRGEFNGLVFTVVKLEDLADRYVLSLTAERDSIAAIVNREGVIVACSYPELMGTEVNRSAGLTQLQAEKINAQLQAGKSGSLIHNCYFDKNKESLKMLTSFAPISVSEEDWMMLVCSPYQNLTTSLKGYQLSHFYGLLAVLVGIVAVSFVFAFGVRLAQREGFIDGYHNGYRLRKKKKR